MTGCLATLQLRELELHLMSVTSVNVLDSIIMGVVAAT